ncbi:MAG: MFS transporter [Candidatus Pacebacteria bacterium]|nr:MFS transporter [Candidatus Paceibacterota bacterium]
MIQERKIIYLEGFLFSIPIALASYINSSFISSFISEKFVGIIYVLGSISSILALLLAPKLFKKIGGYKFLILIATLDAFSFLTLALTKNALGIIAVFILAFSLNALVFFSLDEFLKILSENSVTGKVRGIYLMVCNLAWILAQLISGTILEDFSLRVVYFTSFLVMILFLIISILKLKNLPEPKYDKINSFKYVNKFFQNKNLFRAYGINFLLQFFYCWMVIYTPIYLHAHLGFNWKEIFLIFALMLSPFIFIPFYVGEIADKIGERKILMLGFTIASFTTLSLFFIHQHSIWLWALLLFATRIGASSIDGTSDTYFFKHIKCENEELVGIYRSASPVSYILGPIVAFIILSLVPSLNYIFLILGAIMLYGIYLSSTIRKSDI